MVNDALGNHERGFRERDPRPWLSGAFCTLDCSWTGFCIFCDKHLHSIYKTCLFLLDIRTQLQNPTWSVDPGSGSGLLPGFSAFPDIMYRTRQAIVFKLLCPEKVLGKSCSVNIYDVLKGVYHHVFPSFFFSFGFSRQSFSVYLWAVLELTL